MTVSPASFPETFDGLIALIKAKNAAQDAGERACEALLQAECDRRAIATRAALRARGEVPLSERFPRAA